MLTTTLKRNKAMQGSSGHSGQWRNRQASNFSGLAGHGGRFPAALPDIEGAQRGSVGILTVMACLNVNQGFFGTT
jgi:hypothetical protein